VRAARRRGVPETIATGASLNETRAIHYCVRFHPFLYSRELLVAHAISSGRALQVHE
jgi:hypothetical protein